MINKKTAITKVLCYLFVLFAILWSSYWMVTARIFRSKYNQCMQLESKLYEENEFLERENESLKKQLKEIGVR